MAIALSRPSGRRSDDVRALRFRFRLITFSGNYATGGETLALNGASKTPNVGLSRILAVVPLDSMARAANGVTGNPVTIDVAADGKSVVFRLLEDAAGAAGTAVGQEKTNAEAYIASQVLPVLLIGE